VSRSREVPYDIAIVGGGIVGLATANALLDINPGSRIIILEAESQLATHQTGHNSGVIHSGLYYKPGSLKAKFCAEGRDAMYRFCAEHGVAHERCGKSWSQRAKTNFRAWKSCIGAARPMDFRE